MKDSKTPAVLLAALWPLSILYGGIARLRSWLYDQEWLKQERLRGTVISVGNISVGGTGKTPMVMWLAERFVADGKKVAILSRGYRGAGSRSDEIDLMRQRLRDKVEFGVGKNRAVEGRRLESQDIDIFLLDDGFQHRRLARDVDIVLLDSSRPQERCLLPAGRLREPLSSLRRADIVVFTRVEAGGGKSLSEMQKHGAVPVFTATTHVLGFRRLGEDAALTGLELMGPGPFFAFCGIGNPRAFFADLRRSGAFLAGTLNFRDHHRYTGSDAARLTQAARKSGATAFLTTEKDARNLSGVSFELPVYVCAIEVQIGREDEFLAAIHSVAGRRRGVPS